ncbi:methyl-accepting chemotaxis protein [Kordiimonas lacus]|uniref:HAMP domain-containing protein n=1 Tax=Kordiimonas lacus TaxID=637679 RepID=A0A1G7EEW6_9PROT|nr:methyl-accepting chemotaxis protein [Kordiimonas lacus]SDE62210.1 HAMP domain-containing protein [Kordiimonas lacus]
MAALDNTNATKTNLFSIRNLLAFVTIILMVMIIILTGLRFSSALDNSERAENAMSVNELIDHISSMKLALAEERSLANTAYGFRTEADSFFLTQIELQRSTIRDAFGNVRDGLQDMPEFNDVADNEAMMKQTEARFKKAKDALFAAYKEYEEQAPQVDADLRTISADRQLRGRDSMKTTTAVIEAAANVRTMLENNYDFGDDRISKVILLKHQLWAMIEYATRESAALGGSIVSGSQIRAAMQTLNAQYVGQGKEAWSQVLGIAHSLSIAEEDTKPGEIQALLDAIDQKFFLEFEETRFAIYDASDAAEMDLEGNINADYGMTPTEWVELARGATNPVNGMSIYAGNLSKSLNEDAVSQATLNKWMSVLTFVLVAGIGALAFWVVRYRVVSPVNALSQTMMVLAQGKLEVEVPSADAQDEVGDMARSVQIFKENAIERQRLEAEQREREEQERARAEEEERRKREQEEAQRERELEREETARQERRQAMLDLADKFEASVMAVVQGVSNSATEMENAARGMAETADDTSKKSEVVANAAQQASSNAQMVASAAEELSASVREITGQTNQSSAAARDAVSRTENAGKDVAELVDAAQKIGDVVKLINDIAEQTNLLALNATIEAARAGDAGKGFAVVASEVKSLANQTAKATQEISEQVEGMQQATNLAVRAMDEIKGIIGEIESTSVSIASAVEEQDASTQEIARNVGEVSTGTEEVTSNIHAVNQGATSTGSAATEVLSAAQLLTQQSDELRGQVESFLATIRSE